VLNNTTNGNGLGAGVGMSSNGRMLITGLMNGSGATTNSNNAAFFTGFQNSLSEAARRSNSAAGTTLANWNTNLNFSPINNQVNPSGQVFFASALASAGAGTDVVTSGSTQNDSGSWVVGPGGGGATLIARRGDAPGFLGGAVLGAMTTNPGSNTINANGDVLFGHSLAVAPVGTATTANDSVILVKVGGVLQQVAREAGPVTVNGNPETYLTGTSLANGLSSLGQTWNNNGRAIFGAKFTASANITAGTNDQGIMTWQSGVTTVNVQSGTTVVPHAFGSGTLFDVGSTSNSQTRINNNDHFVFSATLNTVGGITGANDGGLWFADATNVNPTQLIAQEGTVAPGFGGATFGNGFFGVASNNADMVVFQNTLSSGVGSLWGWGPSFGLINLTFVGDTSVLGANYPLSSFNYLTTGNGNGGVFSFNDNGDLALTVGSAGIGGAFGSNAAIVVIHVPAPAVGGLALLGIGALGARRRRN
jgi:MYXO-CTERM domain-containing protein